MGNLQLSKIRECLLIFIVNSSKFNNSRKWKHLSSSYKKRQRLTTIKSLKCGVSFLNYLGFAMRKISRLIMLGLNAKRYLIAKLLILTEQEIDKYNENSFSYLKTKYPKGVSIKEIEKQRCNLNILIGFKTCTSKRGTKVFATISVADRNLST